MDRERLEAAVSEGLSQRGIAAEFRVSQTTVVYWLSKFGLTTDPKKKIVVRRHCGLCGREIPGNERNQSRCVACYVKIKRHRVKVVAVRILGGECARCGWSGHVSGFDLHHKERSSKVVNIGLAAQWSWERICTEIAKCELLCAICHRQEHAIARSQAFLEAARRYEEADLQRAAEILEENNISLS